MAHPCISSSLSFNSISLLSYPNPSSSPASSSKSSSSPFKTLHYRYGIFRKLKKSNLKSSLVNAVLALEKSSRRGIWSIRIIICGGEVDDDMANIIVARFLYLDAVDPSKDIVMHVTSQNGSFSLSCCWMFADQGKRYSLPNSRIMIHQPLGGAQGDQTDIDSQGPQRTGLSISGPMSLSSLWFSISSTFLYERLEFNFPDIISVKNITATEICRPSGPLPYATISCIFRHNMSFFVPLKFHSLFDWMHTNAIIFRYLIYPLLEKEI